MANFKLDKWLICRAATSMLVAAVITYFLQPLISGNKDATDVLVNVFSILAGFLVAVMTIIGEPIFFRGKTWRHNQVRRGNYRKALQRHKLLFQFYLITLALIFVSRLIKPDSHPELLLWVERGYLFFSVVTFLMSFSLPNQLISKQLERFDEQVSEKKSRRPDK